MVPDPGPERVGELQQPQPGRPDPARPARPRAPEEFEEEPAERPRPRKRRPRPAPPKRSPYLVPLLIGGGVLALSLLVCGGGLAVWYFGGDDARPRPPDVAAADPAPGPGGDPARPARPTGPAGPPPPAAPDPQGFDFTDPEGAFRITFPAGPPFREDAGAIVDEQMEFSKHLSKNLGDEELEQWKRWAKEQFKGLNAYAWYAPCDGRRYRVMVTSLDSGPFAGMSGHDLLDAHTGSYRQLGVPSVTSKRLVIDGGDWVQAEWRRPDGKSQVDRVCIAGRFMILLSVNALHPGRVGTNRVPADDPPVKAFFDSFKTQLPVKPPRAAGGAKE